jgi:hypothetical protein
MTVYCKRIFNELYNHIFCWSRGYRHFNSEVDDFYNALGQYRVSSINNHALDLDRLGEFRISRLIRDPRDLIVSGYFYHKKGFEPWSKITAPNFQDWKIVNGNVPNQLNGKESFSGYLQRVSLENGLIAEIDFRKWHFHSMKGWPENDPRILCFKYEDILFKERLVFGKLLRFYGIPIYERKLGQYLAHKYSAQRQQRPGRRVKHIRNPKSSQWRDIFTPKVKAYFNERYEPLIKELGYSID